MTNEASKYLFYPNVGHLKPFHSINTNHSLLKKAERIEEGVQQMMQEKHYPCIRVLQSFHADAYRVGVYGDLGRGEQRNELRQDLLRYVQEQAERKSKLLSFWAVFYDTPMISEGDFEARLGQELSYIADPDKTLWDPGNGDPGASEFRFHLQGTPLYVFGMHPRCARVSRRFRYSALIFNVQQQFPRNADPWKSPFDHRLSSRVGNVQTPA